MAGHALGRLIERNGPNAFAPHQPTTTDGNGGNFALVDELVNLGSPDTEGLSSIGNRVKQLFYLCSLLFAPTCGALKTYAPIRCGERR